MKPRPILRLAGATLICLLTILASAIHNKLAAQEPAKISVCEADIFYSWKRLPPKSPSEDSSSTSAPEASANQEAMEVFFTRTGEQGAVEEEVKAKLETKLETIKAEAISTCRDDHEDQAHCVTAGIKRIAREYNLADYTSRGALLKSVTDTCEQSVGNCVSARAGEVKCYIHHPPDEAPAGEAEAGGDKKKKK